MRSVCVFCGSAEGVDEVHKQFARDVGRLIGQSRMRLIYGGGNLGLMGLVAKSCEAQGGEVVGVIPGFLNKAHIVNETNANHIVTEDMHDRKMRMFELADIFVALPGGIGTLEELTEIITLRQLGRHKKPIVMANVGGFWNPLIDLITHMRSEGYIHAKYEIDFDVIRSVDQLSTVLDAVPERQAASA